MDSDQIQQTGQGDLNEKLFQQQKRELAILNAIVQTVSNTNNLKETLETVLDIILMVISCSAGWICLLDEKKGWYAFAGYKGVCFAGNQGTDTPCQVQCVCNCGRRTREVVIIWNLHTGCPLLQSGACSNPPEDIVGHVSIPLTTPARIVGQLNVAFKDHKQVEEIDIDLLKMIAPQLVVVVENAKLWAEIQEKESLRKELIKRVVIAQEEERRRISRELHDEFGQELTSLLVRLQVLENMEGNSKSYEVIEGLKKSTLQMLSSIHDLSLELRPTILDDLGLVPALTQFIRSCPGYLGIEVEFGVLGLEDRRLPRAIETTLYRVIQEALTNVARHSGVKEASVYLKLEDSRVVSIVEDNGVGFDVLSVRGGLIRNNRIGLYGMEERVSLVGGDFLIISTPGKGTMIRVEIPIS